MLDSRCSMLDPPASTAFTRNRLEQAPRHGSHLVEELKSGFCAFLVDSTRLGQQPKECIHLFFYRRAFGPR